MTSASLALDRIFFGFGSRLTCTASPLFEPGVFSPDELPEGVLFPPGGPCPPGGPAGGLPGFLLSGSLLDLEFSLESVRLGLEPSLASLVTVVYLTPGTKSANIDPSGIAG